MWLRKISNSFYKQAVGTGTTGLKSRNSITNHVIFQDIVPPLSIKQIIFFLTFSDKSKYKAQKCRSQRVCVCLLCLFFISTSFQSMSCSYSFIRAVSSYKIYNKMVYSVYFNELWKLLQLNAKMKMWFIVVSININTLKNKILNFTQRENLEYFKEEI